MKNIVAATLCMVAVPAVAQTGPAPDPATTAVSSSTSENRWQSKFEISASPRFGRRQAFDSSQDLVDESEGEVSFALQRLARSGLQLGQLKFGATWSPQWLDDGDPQSAYYAEATIGDAYLPLEELLQHAPISALLTPAGQARDALRPYGRYRYTRVHNDLFDSFSRDEHRVTGGLRWRNVLSIACARATAAPRTREEECSGVPGVWLELRAEANYVWSSDRTEERFSPLVRLDVTSRPLAGRVRLFGRSQIDANFYDHAVVGLTTEEREDWRLRLTAGIDLSDLWQDSLPGFRVELAGQFQQRWSNDPARDHARFYFVPSISWSRAF